MRITSQVVRIERRDRDDGLVALTFTDPSFDVEGSADLPLVFVLHGLGSRKERHLDLCLRLSQAGFRACAVDARFHGDRQSAESQALWGEKTSLSFIMTFGQTVVGTVEDLSRIADDMGAPRYGVVGHSMGGFIATVAALTDRRAVAVVNVGGSIDTQLPPSLLALLPVPVQEAVRALDPIRRAAELWPTAVLLVHGEIDDTVPVAGARRLHAAAAPAYAGDPSRLSLVELPGVGHEFTPEEARLSVEFLTRFLKEHDGDT